MKISKIVNANNENNTMVRGVEIINDTKSTEIMKKKTGLSLLMIGLSEIHSYRLSKLSSLLVQIERELFNEQTLSDLTPAKLHDLHKTVNTSIQESVAFIKDTVRNSNWTDLELQLLELSNADEEADEEAILRKTSASDSANDILRAVTSLVRNGSSVQRDSDDLMEDDEEESEKTEYSLDDFDDEGGDYHPEVNGSVIIDNDSDISSMVDEQHKDDSDFDDDVVTKFTVTLDDVPDDDESEER